MKQAYNIIFKSTQGEGANIYSKKFFFDFGQLPEGQYKVNYNFVCLNNISFDQNILIYLNLGNCNTFETVLNQTTSISSDLLGYAYLYAPSTTYKCYKKEFGNEGFYINRPIQNYITINMLFQNKNPVLLLTNYILMLNLELQE